MRKLFFSICSLAALACDPTQLGAQPGRGSTYDDGARGTITLPQGDRSFADRVVSHRRGSGKIADTARDSDAVLGPPDFSGDVRDGSFLSLGCDGTTEYAAWAVSSKPKGTVGLGLIIVNNRQFRLACSHSRAKLAPGTPRYAPLSRFEDAQTQVKGAPRLPATAENHIPI